MKDFFKTKYRIVRDNYCGYEVQFRYWWMPFYFQGDCNTHVSVERALAYANKKRNKVILYVD